MGDDHFGYMGRSRATGGNICRASPLAVAAKKAMARGQQDSGMARGNNNVEQIVGTDNAVRRGEELEHG